MEFRPAKYNWCRFAVIHWPGLYIQYTETCVLGIFAMIIELIAMDQQQHVAPGDHRRIRDNLVILQFAQAAIRRRGRRVAFQ